MEHYPNSKTEESIIGWFYGFFLRMSIWQAVSDELKSFALLLIAAAMLNYFADVFQDV